jgi:hypothetical protein
MSESTAIGIAKVAAAMSEMMQANASPADRAIQAGIDECMRGVIRAQTSQSPNALKCPTHLPDGVGPRRPAQDPDFGGPLCVVPSKRRGWQQEREIGPVVKPESMEARVMDRMIDNACGPLAKPKASE